MDIDLLSKMVKELILDRDTVVLPGLGAFVAEIVPASFSDKGYTINPPYRKLSFRSTPDQGWDLIRFYAESNEVDIQVAEKAITDFVQELKTVLYTRKTVIFPGLGRLRATKENTVFFVSDEDLDIYPEGFGLEPVSLKNHVETPEEVAEVISGLKAIVEQPQTEAEIDPEIKPEPEAEPDSEQGPDVEPLTEPAPETEAEPEPAPEPEDFIPEIPETDPDGSEGTEDPGVPEEPEADSDEQEAVQDEGIAMAEAESKAERRGRRAGITVAVVLLSIVALALLLLGAFMAVAHFQPQLLDTILYSPEELDILYHK